MLQDEASFTKLHAEKYDLPPSIQSIQNTSYDLIASDDLAVVLPNWIVEGVAHHEAGPLRRPHLA